MKYSFGWKPDKPDKRDRKFRMVSPGMILPPVVDLRILCSPVEDQGDLGSCTANALVGALEFLENKDKVAFEDLSRLFVYYNERCAEGSIDYDAGAELRDGIKTLVSFGCCSEELLPYDINKFTDMPSLACYHDAANHKVITYESLGTVDQMRTCLADGYPFVFGFTVYDSFMSDEVANTGIVPMPSYSETVQGGHAVMAVGYDDLNQWFIVRNSWGIGFGDKGYMYMPFNYLKDRGLSDDFWVIYRAQNL